MPSGINGVLFMKRIVIVFLICVLVLFLFSLGVGYFGPREAVHHLYSESANKPLVILTPNPQSLGIGIHMGQTTQTYTSKEGGFSVTYPKVWTPSLDRPLSGFSGNIPTFDTGPIGSRVLGFPSFLQIAVDENPNNLTASEFVHMHDSGFTVSNEQLGQNTYLMVKGSKVPVLNSIYVLYKNHKIYQIRDYEGVAPIITMSQLQKVLASFTVN